MPIMTDLLWKSVSKILDLIENPRNKQIRSTNRRYYKSTLYACTFISCDWPFTVQLQACCDVNTGMTNGQNRQPGWLSG